MLDKIKELCTQCQNCCLGKIRKNIAFGVGNPKAKIMFIGDAIEENDDLECEPFAREAGKLLDKILEAVSIKREDIYITNIIKCMLPKNRIPKEYEVEACREFIEAEIALVNPRIIVTLGEMASQFFLGKEGKITKVRGYWFKEKGIDLICTFHPETLLKDPSKKRPVWEDFKKIQERLKEN